MFVTIENGHIGDHRNAAGDPVPARASLANRSSTQGSREQRLRARYILDLLIGDLMTNDNDRALVYVVDDDCDLGASLARLLRRSGYAAEPFLDPQRLLASYSDAPADCVVTDVMLGDFDGFILADKLRDIDAATSVIFMTAGRSVGAAVDSIRRHGGLDYVEKPIDEPRLLAAIDEGVAWSRRRRAA